MHETSFYCGISINLACLKIFRWWKSSLRNSPQTRQISAVRLSVAAVASNIANRVLSASAFDMFSISFVSHYVPSVQVSSLRQFLEAAEVFSTHLVFGSVVPVAASEPKRSMGQVREPARPEIKRLGLGRKLAIIRADAVIAMTI